MWTKLKLTIGTKKERKKRVEENEVEWICSVDSICQKEKFERIKHWEDRLVGKVLPLEFGSKPRILKNTTGGVHM